MVKFAIIRNRNVDRYIIEYVLGILHHINKSGNQAFLTTFDSAKNDYDVGIIVDTEIQIPEDIDLTKKYVLLNTEQLTRPIIFHHVKSILDKYPSFLYADYSTANIKIMGKGIWLPYFRNPSIKFDRTKPKIYDKVFIGAKSIERDQICKQYGARFIHAWSTERDNIIQQSNCQLNMHFNNEYNVLETMRIYHSIYLGTPVFILDNSLEEEIFLGKDAQKYMLRTPYVPANLPHLTFEEEDRKAMEIITNFISTYLS